MVLPCTVPAASQQREMGERTEAPVSNQDVARLEHQQKGQHVSVHLIVVCANISKILFWKYS
jgi:hypothetical protein